jgi:hypothetical protein
MWQMTGSKDDREYGHHEPQRVFGFPVEGGRWRLRMDAYEPRAMGLPARWFGTPHLDTRWLHHPVRWLRWRADVRRRGPYAPSFDELARRARSAKQQ